LARLAFIVHAAALLGQGLNSVSGLASCGRQDGDKNGGVEGAHVRCVHQSASRDVTVKPQGWPQQRSAGMGEGESVDVRRPGLRHEGAGRMHRSLEFRDAVVRVLLCGPLTLLTMALFPVIFRWPAAVMRVSRPWLTPVLQPAKRLASVPVDFLAARVLKDPR